MKNIMHFQKETVNSWFEEILTKNTRFLGLLSPDFLNQYFSNMK